MRRDQDKLLHHILKALRELESDAIINGLGTEARRTSLAFQIIDSYRRIEYVQLLKSRDICEARCDPSTDLFDPLKAAIAHKRKGDIDESFWMVFLFVHFGKHKRGGWRYAREVYNALGQRDRWSWKNTSQDPKGFRKWLAQNAEVLERPGGGFGNHRQYMSLKADTNSHTGAAFETYVSWIGATGSHTDRFKKITVDCADDPGERFHALFRSMDAVSSFGRLSKFDYLCMVGKLDLYDIEPNSVYMSSATGPKAGGKLLFVGDSRARRSTAELEDDYERLKNKLGFPFCMQILEDAVCNWQKSPDSFKAFRG